MLTKHSFKILITFVSMIVFGLLGVFTVSYFDGNLGQEAMTCETDNSC